MDPWHDFEDGPDDETQILQGELTVEQIQSTPTKFIEEVPSEIKGRLRSKTHDDDLNNRVFGSHTVAFKMDRIEYDEMRRILRQDEDPRFGQEAAVFLRHAVAKYIEEHNATVHNDPLARYTMNVGMSELTKLAAADQLEREYLNRLEMTLRACRGQSERRALRKDGTNSLCTC